ncbi:hypothetical protein BH80429_12870 [Bartonella henselae]|nr:hypothetical protein BH623125_04930 [Bartonella henselae]GFF04466.1 hypothetical protein BH80429_12870 [Bartonella henselae]
MFGLFAREIRPLGSLGLPVILGLPRFLTVFMNLPFEVKKNSLANDDSMGKILSVMLLWGGAYRWEGDEKQRV